MGCTAVSDLAEKANHSEQQPIKKKKSKKGQTIIRRAPQQPFFLFFHVFLNLKII
jgi:hypothetical protein